MGLLELLLVLLLIVLLAQRTLAHARRAYAHARAREARIRARAARILARARAGPALAQRRAVPPGRAARRRGLAGPPRALVPIGAANPHASMRSGG